MEYVNQFYMEFDSEIGLMDDEDLLALFCGENYAGINSVSFGYIH